MYSVVIAHLLDFSPHIIEDEEGQSYNRSDYLYPMNGLILGLTGRSGTGKDAASHLHLTTRKGLGVGGKPGINPFVLGIDRDDIGKYPNAGRLAYWDGETDIPFGDANFGQDTEAFLYQLPKKIESYELGRDVDANDISEKLLSLRTQGIMALREYLGREVLQMHPDTNGHPIYRHLPDSGLYSVMLEVFGLTAKSGMYKDQTGRGFVVTGNFTASLPFVYPSAKIIRAYEAANPGRDLKLPPAAG